MALLFATESHGSRTCANTEVPYMTQVLDAYRTLAKTTDDDATRVALLLHDTLQYDLVSIHYINEAFGNDVATILEPLSSIDKLDKPDQWPNKGVGIIEEITLHFIEEEATPEQLLLLASIMITNIQATQETFLKEEWPEFPSDEIVEDNDEIFDDSGKTSRLSREKRSSIAYYEAIAESFMKRVPEVPSLEGLVDQLNGKAYWFLRT